MASQKFTEDTLTEESSIQDEAFGTSSPPKPPKEKGWASFFKPSMLT